MASRHVTRQPPKTERGTDSTPFFEGQRTQATQRHSSRFDLLCQRNACKQSQNVMLRVVHSSTIMAEASTSPPPPKVRRKFAPVPVETTIRSRKEDNDGTAPTSKPSPNMKDSIDRQDVTPKRRFLPTPIETTVKSSKPGNAGILTPEATPVAASIPRTSPPEEKAQPRRPRFAPQLIETSKRSKKAGDSAPATLPTDKVRIAPQMVQVQLCMVYEQFGSRCSIPELSVHIQLDACLVAIPTPIESALVQV